MWFQFHLNSHQIHPFCVYCFIKEKKANPRYLYVCKMFAYNFIQMATLNCDYLNYRHFIQTNQECEGLQLNTSCDIVWIYKFPHLQFLHSVSSMHEHEHLNQIQFLLAVLLTKSIQFRKILYMAHNNGIFDDISKWCLIIFSSKFQSSWCYSMLLSELNE